MTSVPLTPIEIGLTAAIVAVEGEEPTILVAGDGSKGDTRAGLLLRSIRSAGASHVRDRIARLGRGATGLTVGYVEQLYTFGDRGRHAGRATPARTWSRSLSRAHADAGDVRGAALRQRRFRAMVSLLSLEDWREKRPDILDKVILPHLDDWAGRSNKPSPGARSADANGCGSASPMVAVKASGWTRAGWTWDEEKVLDRYELLYEAGLVEEARRDGREAALARRPSHAGRVDALRSPAHPRDRDCAAARQAQNIAR
jgi:hypothetical protein